MPVGQSSSVVPFNCQIFMCLELDDVGNIMQEIGPNQPDVKGKVGLYLHVYMRMSNSNFENY